MITYKNMGSMLSLSNLTLLAVLCVCMLSNIIPFLKNLQLARTSRIPYVIVPYHSYNRIGSALMSRVLLRPCLKYLGQPLPTSWRTLVGSDWARKHRHHPFAILKTDTFMTVAPGGIVLHTADANVVSQVTSRQNDFPKASHLYSVVNMYGENVVATESATWRYHRKLTSPMFGESNNEFVWEQSLRDAKAMLSIWLRSKEQAITTLTHDSTLLSLSVIGRAGLGQTIQWPSANLDKSDRLNGELAPNRHRMTFTTALTTVLRNIYYIVLSPPWFLRYAPIKVVKESYTAYLEWGQYLREIVSSKREAISSPSSLRKSDLLSALLQEHEEATLSTKADRYRLSDSEILGNLFVMVLAGHETTASSIHFCLILLAMHPQVQREVQADLDLIFGSHSVEQWRYEHDLHRLLNSKLNAVLNEELRLFAPTPTIPKYTNVAQRLQINGKDVLVPAKAILRMCLPPLHRNPAYWHSSSSDVPVQEDVERFRPSR